MISTWLAKMLSAAWSAVLWSYPEDGASDVPVDATLWARVNHLNIESATLNGIQVPHEDVGFHGVEIEPGALSPDTDYVLILTGWEGQLPVSISFRTGAGKSPSAPILELKGWAASGGLPRDGSSFCAAILNGQDCFDTGQDTLLSLQVAAGDAIAWRMAPVKASPAVLWPSQCGDPAFFLHGEYLPRACFEVAAIGLGGKEGPRQRWCHPGPLEPAVTRVIDCDDALGTEQPTPGEILAKVEPLPTEISRRARVTGIVKLQASVGETGTVTAVKVLQEVPIGLSKRAQEVVSTWRFAPAMRDGRAVSSVLCLASEFPGFEP